MVRNNRLTTIALIAFCCLPVFAQSETSSATQLVTADDQVDYRLVSSKKAMSASMYQRLLGLGIDFPENNDNNTPWFGRMPVTIIGDELYLAMVKKDGVENDLAAKAIFYALYNKIGVMTRNGQPYLAYQPEQIAHNIRAQIPQFSNPNDADMFILAFAGKSPDDPDGFMKFVQRDDQNKPEGKAANEAANLTILQALLDLKLATHPELQAQYAADQKAETAQQLNRVMDTVSNLKRVNDIYGYMRR
jgi:hypothetical protein